MRTAHARRLPSVWHQALVLVLALGMGLQGVPVESLLHAADSSCVCAEQNYCPRNPDGDCACPHHGHDRGHGGSASESENTTTSASTPVDSDRLVLRSCDTTGPDASPDDDLSGIAEFFAGQETDGGGYDRTDPPV